MTDHDYPMLLRNPRNTVGKSQSSWNQCDKGIQTPSHWDGREEPTSVTSSRGMMTTLAEVCVSQDNNERPSRYYKAAVAAVETDANGTKEGKDQLKNSDGHSTVIRAAEMNGIGIAEPMIGPIRPVMPNINAMNDTDIMHYEWIVRNSVRTTETLTTDNYLEVPVLQLPRRFLHLAAEARTVEITKDKLCYFSDIHPQGIELPQPVRVTVMMDSPVKNCELNDRVDRGVSPNTTEQPLRLGLSSEWGETAPIDIGDSDDNLTEHSKPVDRLDPVDPINLSEQPASLGLRMDGVGNSPMCREDSMTLSAGQDEPVNRLRQGGSHYVSGQPVEFGLDPNDRERISTRPVDYDMA